ncbi:TolC family protein [Inhella gelatinilytica]|uniref:TolC family protein n=1 Tax=Inhella gelatinilytica TaxID=2795030 RepID=A0A931NE02_9BURK|nr:TolC family protein [Inhella gelatinilytica]MBH9553652.1 TolC family protein [Inhella gelatinilytica]
MNRVSFWAVVLGVLGLSGCANLESGRALGTVQSLTQGHTGHPLMMDRSADDLARTHKRVTELLQRPLAMDAAVQVALLNNRGLQARLQFLGVTEAEVQQAARLPNPGFSFGRVTKGHEVELERGLHVSLARLLALPLVSRLETRRLEAVQREVAMEVLSLAADTRKAWVQVVAAGESLRYMRQVQEAAEASAELARRLQQAGNFNALARLREQGFYADAALGLARADQAHRAARERLIRLLGLWGESLTLQLPDRLPDLPAAPKDQPDIERQALAQRLDVQAARFAAEQMAKNLQLTQVTRFVSVFELGLARSTSNDGPRQTGWEIDLELPLFDWGGARVAKAEGLYMQAVHQAAATAIQARSEVREAYGNYRASYDIARHHRDEIVPLKKRISDEQLLRYNGMLIGVFELLADARSQIASVNASIEALRDFWLAQADLDMALVGRVALSAPTATAAPAPEAGGGH